MIRDIAARGSGKTTRALEWLYKTKGGILVVHSSKTVVSVKDTFRYLYGDVPNRYITSFFSFISGRDNGLYRDSPVYIDELDLCIFTTFRGLVGYSLTPNENYNTESVNLSDNNIRVKLQEELSQLNENVKNSLYLREEFFKRHPELIPLQRQKHSNYIAPRDEGDDFFSE